MLSSFNAVKDSRTSQLIGLQAILMNLIIFELLLLFGPLPRSDLIYRMSTLIDIENLCIQKRNIVSDGELFFCHPI